MATKSDREHIYVACAPGSNMLDIFREIGEGMLSLIFKLDDSSWECKKLDIGLSLNPFIKASFENKIAELPVLKDANEAVRTLKMLDEALPDARQTVVVIDELEELSQENRNSLAYLIKQLGDQEFETRFMFVGIAENVFELLGTHASVPRYLTEIHLKPLIAQDLIDIIDVASNELSISVDRDIKLRIAMIGNGFPYYAHLIGKTMFVEAVERDLTVVSKEVFIAGVNSAIDQSLQELKISYDAASQRGADYFKYLLWALADFDEVDVRINDWEERYQELAIKCRHETATANQFKNAYGNLLKEGYGAIIRKTPAVYGDTETRYRYRRFSNPLMKGYIRLQAESEGFQLGLSTDVANV